MTIKSLFSKQPEEKKEKHFSQMTKEELHAVLGDFEKEYEAHSVGAWVSNDYIGYVKQGIVDWMKNDLKVIACKENFGLTYWFVVLPQWYDFEKKWNAWRELLYRREQAKKTERQAIQRSELGAQFDMKKATGIN